MHGVLIKGRVLLAKLSFFSLFAPTNPLWRKIPITEDKAGMRAVHAILVNLVPARVG